MTKKDPASRAHDLSPRLLNDGQSELVRVDSGRIKVHPKNPRRGDLAAIRESIARRGFYGAITVNRRTGHIVAGNHRFIAAQALGFDVLPVVWVDVGKAEEERILAADNRTSDLGTYDSEALATLLEGLVRDEDGEGLAGTGYSEEDLEGILSGLAPPSDEDFEEAFGALPKDHVPLQNMTFTLHDDQAAQVKRALEVARGLGAFGDTGNENSNGNALARVCEVFLTTQGGGHGRR